MKTLLTAALAAGLAPLALADTVLVQVPSGFNAETNPTLPTTVELADGTHLLVTGSFGAQGLSVVHPDGTVTPFATGFGSVAGIAQSPVTGQIVVGDSAGATALLLLDDLNDDGDVLDAGELVPHPAQPPVLSNGAAPLPFDIAFEPGSDRFFMSGSTPFSVVPALGVVTVTEAGSASVYAEGFGFPGALAFDGDTLLAADVDADSFIGRVVGLRDLNDDGDALDAGEHVFFADGFAGAGGFVGLADGSFLLGTGFGGTVETLHPDADDDGASDAITTFAAGFGFAGGLTLTEGAGGFVAGVDGDGELRVSDFTVGSVAVRTAPLATTSVDGVIANDASFDIVVGGAPGAQAVFILSLDVAGTTLPGVGDLCVGFGAPFVISPLLPVDGNGESRTTLVFHGLPGLVGLSLGVQGFVLEGGQFGIGDGIVETVQ